MEVSGFIEPILYVSSDVKDTDFTIKLIDVYPDGRAFNLDESIQRVRYRNQMKACEPGMTRVVVSAPGRALDLQEVHVADDMDSVDFQLKPGGKVRLKVVDPEGNPLPKAGFFV